MSRSVLIFFVGACGFAQLPGPPAPAFPETLRRYLDLSNNQVDAISRLNADYDRKFFEKQARMSQVRGEIFEETRKDNLDPMALGIRYAEIEAIQRDLRDELAKVRVKTREALNDAQRLKLKALEDAIKLQPVINEAQCENLLEPQVFGFIMRDPFPGNVIPVNRIDPVSGIPIRSCTFFAPPLPVLP